MPTSNVISMKEMGAPRRTRLPSISLFSGAMGLDLGLELAGFHVRVCVDSMMAACETIILNRANIPVINADIRGVSTREILNVAGLRKGEVALVSGGPPCQSFSVLGTRKGLNDSRGQLIYEFIRVVKEADARAFVLENVSGITMSHSNDATELICQEFEKLGYFTTYKALNAVNFGVPQHRKRVFFVGCKDQRISLSPRKTHGDNGQFALEDGGFLLPARTVRDAFTNPPLDKIPNHVKRNHGELVRRRYGHLKPGERDRVDHTDRLDWDKPSGTLLVGSSEGGGRPHIHPEEPRVITVREAARLQTFPDNWVFAGTVTAQYRLTGNAVPVLLARAVGESLREALEHPPLTMTAR